MRTTAVLMALALAAGVRAGGTDTFFNGKDLSGWEGNEKLWSVKDGELIGSTAPDGIRGNTFLCSKKKYGDFELKFQVRLLGKTANSGVQIRSKLVNPEKFVVHGPQADMGQQYWGSLYGEGIGGMMKASDADAVKRVLKKDEFNDYYIKCVGKHVTIKLNGETMVDDDFEKMESEGIIAWQLHAGGSMDVTFRNIQFRELKK
jgi:Domain of Unknown Function (DUF1080)